MLKIAALTSGRNAPSTRFRVRQHIESLRPFDIDVAEYCPAINKNRRLPGWCLQMGKPFNLPFYAALQTVKLSTRLPGLVGSWRSQITWLERLILPGFLTLETVLRKPFVFDVDDAIWLQR